ncbi:MAG: hypothetical protein R3Y24_00390 [Eubacteriales bacterium]
MKEIKGYLFIKEKNEPDIAYRAWDALAEEEKEQISIILNRTAAETIGYTKIIDEESV